MTTYIHKNELTECELSQLEAFEDTCQTTLYYHEFGNMPFDCFHMILDENQTILSYLAIYGTEESCVELSGATHPNYRNLGYFHELFSNVYNLLIKNNISMLFGDKNPKLSYLSFEPAYSELLLKKEPDLLPVPCILTRGIREFDYTEDENLDIYYVVDFIDIPVGLFHITGTPSFACIHNVKIRPAYRRQGYATTLIQCGLEHFFHSYNCPVYLHVGSKNKPAISLYQHCGFETVEEITYFKITPRL